MKWFEVDCKLKEEDIEWAREIGDNITEPNWTIRPYKLNEEEMNRISYLNDQIGIEPSYAAIIMVPKNSTCKTHVDDKADTVGVRQRITAINIPVQVHKSSRFEYMIDDPFGPGEIAMDMIKLNTPKCWRVDIPHRVYNEKSPTNRIVLSLSFTQSIKELHEIYSATKNRL